MENKNIKNIKALTADLYKKYNELNEGSLDIKSATTYSHLAGQIFKGEKLQLQYNQFMNKKDKLDGFED